MKIFISLLSFSLLFLTTSCDWFEYHPYDAQVRGETHINLKNRARIEEACAEKETIRFAFLSDTQRWYDETEDAVKFINTKQDIDFVIHGGDISDFGLTKEFLWQRDILNKLKVPYVVLLGNHDCLGNGNKVFREVFGDYNFSFMAGNIKFVCLNTNAIEFDYSIPVPDFEFIEKELNDQNPLHQKTVVAMHAAPFDEQFNNNVARVFQRYITEFPGLMFCINGHGHKLSEEDLFDDGIIYYETPNIAKRTFLLFTITPDDYTYEVIEY